MDEPDFCKLKKHQEIKKKMLNKLNALFFLNEIVTYSLISS